MSEQDTLPKEHTIALEIDGQRHETTDHFIVHAIQELLIKHDVLEEGDILEALVRDRDYILHKY